MGWLKSIFGRKAAEQEIPIGSLLDWLDNETKPLYDLFENRAKEYVAHIKARLKELKEKIPALENAEIKDEDTIQIKVKSVVLGHRGNYIRMLSRLINSVSIPEDVSHGSIMKFLDAASKNLDEFTKNSTKSYYASQHLFHREIEDIARIINEIDNALKNIRKSAEKADIIRINMLKGKISGLSQAIQTKEKLESMMEENKKRLNEAELSRQLAEKKLKDLAHSREFRNFNELTEELNGIKNDILQQETNILQIFSPLERALKKFSRITLEEDMLVESYASGPVAALMSDTGLVIIDLLQNMKKSIMSGSIELKDKQKEKTLDVIDSLTKEQLANIVYKYSTLQEKKESFERQIKANKVTNTKKELQYRLEHAELMLNKARNELLETEKNREKIDIMQLKTDLENSLKDLLKQEIKIRLD